MGFPDNKVGRLFDAQQSKESLRRQRAYVMLMHQVRTLPKGRKVRNLRTKRVPGRIDASRTRVCLSS